MSEYVVPAQQTGNVTERVNKTTMSEVYRFIEGMHYINWSDEKINKIICYIESGDMKYIEELKAIIENEKQG